ncbi:MAG TPA: hypothetical protein VMR19_01650 [Candidatus Saccharimonadales bacterium]|jgi:hypothetical protein|nr:hypothetical protein [Candidatus Saccharimonadales bacterium]
MLGEPVTNNELLSPTEGKLAYETAEWLATNIAQVPEFREELVRSFFTRSRHGRSGGVDAVVFDKGDFRYRVDFHSDGATYQSESRSVRATLTKWVKEEADDERIKPQDLHPLVELHLYSWFTEPTNEKGAEKNFKGGSVELTLNGFKEPNATGQAAVDSIPEHFGDLLSQPIEF